MPGVFRFNPCESCCADIPKECVPGNCDFTTGEDPRTIPDEWIIDLGAGGWVDDGCSECDQVSGQYTLGFNSGNPSRWCGWIYSDEDFCTASCALSPTSMDLNMTLVIVSGATGWKWRLTVAIEVSLTCWVYERFETADVVDSDCFYFGGEGALDKITLTRLYSSLNRYNTDACSLAGRLPTTVEAWTLWTEPA